MKFLRIIPWLILCFAIILVFACQGDSKKGITNVDQAYKEYELQPSVEKAEQYLDTLDNFIRRNIEQKELIKPYLERGVDVSIAQGLLSRTSGYMLPLLRLFPDLENRNARLLSLGDVMHALRKRHASSVIYNELAKKMPGDPQVQQKAGLIDSVARSTENYVDYLFDQILVNPDEFGVNRAASLRYVDGVEALALVSPEKENVPGHLYKAAEVARSMRTFPKAMSLYDWLIERYPDYDKSSTALFIKGFILEQDYGREEEARAIYTRFLAEYPDHEMAESAQFLLNNLGKSDEEILQSIEAQKNQSN